MKPITCVFFGRSGSGKGTQANLLIEYLKKQDADRKVVYVETGDRFRKFVNQSGTYSAQRTKDVMAAGGLMPAFIPIWAWTNLLIEEYTGSEHLVFDGVSRRPDEAPILDGALAFFGRTDTAIIVLDTSIPEATARLMKRGRYDDKPEKIAERLKWFETDVVPAIDVFRKSKNCKVLTINGDQSVEAVHTDILKALGI